MLRVCKHIDVTSMSEASLKRKHHSVLDLYFEMYLDEVENFLRKGLIKNYRKTSNNILVLKGRLDFNKNIQQVTLGPKTQLKQVLGVGIVYDF